MVEAPSGNPLRARTTVVVAVALLFVGIGAHGGLRWFLTSVGMLLPVQLGVAWLVAGRRSSGGSISRAMLGGGMFGSVSGIMLMLQGGHYSAFYVVVGAIMGAVCLALTAPLALAMQLPMHVACVRARTHPTMDGDDATLLVAGLWLASADLLLLIVGLLAGERRIGLMIGPVVTLAIGCGAAYVASRRLRTLADFVQSVRAGGAAFRSVSLSEYSGETPERLWRASHDPKDGEYDAVILRVPSAPYRDTKPEMAIGILPRTFDPRIASRYLRVGRLGVIGTGVAWLMLLFVLFGAFGLVSKQPAPRPASSHS